MRNRRLQQEMKNLDDLGIQVVLPTNSINVNTPSDLGIVAQDSKAKPEGATHDREFVVKPRKRPAA